MAATNLANPEQVRRNDGTRVALKVSADWLGELRALAKLLKERSILLMLPAFIASNWYYAYFFSMNSFYFSLRGRALNGTLFWVMEPLGALTMGRILDLKRLSRRSRGLVGLAVLAVCTCSVWTGGAFFQASFDRDQPSPKLDWDTDRRRWGQAFALYISYGFLDAMSSTYRSWLIGTRSNSPQVLARYSGIYRCVQSAGAALSFVVDAVGSSLLTQ